VAETNSSHHSSGDFVPLERLRRPRPEKAGADLESIERHLQDLAGQLSPGERDALASILGRLDSDRAFLELAALSPEIVLKPEEAGIYQRLLACPLPKPYSLSRVVALIMKGTRLCNLRCTYCRSWAEGPNENMPFEVLARAIQSSCTAPGVDHVEFIWHGGETTLRPISFYRGALWLQQRFRRPGLAISNQMQTNGTNLSSDWLQFLKSYQFTVGISLDGPPEINDQRRFDVKGRPTSQRVRQGIESLKNHGIEFDVKMVVDDAVIALGARRLLDYLLEIGVARVALLNVVPEGDPERKLPGDYLEFPRFVEFLRELFHLWWPVHSSQISFRELSDLWLRLKGERGSFCVFDSNCMGSVFTVEPNGKVAACDRYQGDPSYTFGNILNMDFSDLRDSVNLDRAHVETAAEMDVAGSCRWSKICHGGCPHDRYVRIHRGVSKDENCCGWAPLISDMSLALTQAPSALTNSKESSLTSSFSRKET